MTTGNNAIFFLFLLWFPFSSALAQIPLSDNEDSLWGECSKEGNLTAAIHLLTPATVFLYGTPSLTVSDFSGGLSEFGYKGDLGVRRAALTSWKFTWNFSAKDSEMWQVHLGQRVYLPSIPPFSKVKKAGLKLTPNEFCQQWISLLTSLVKHEQAHVRLNVEQFDAMRSFVKGKVFEDGQSVKRYMADAMSQLHVQHKQFDKEHSWEKIMGEVVD
jgi:hypothetical protein